MPVADSGFDTDVSWNLVWCIARHDLHGRGFLHRGATSEHEACGRAEGNCRERTRATEECHGDLLSVI